MTDQETTKGIDDLFPSEPFVDRVVDAQEAACFGIQFGIQKRMRELGMSPHDLAKIMGVSEGRIQQVLMSDEFNLTIKGLAKLAVALDLPWRELFTGHERAKERD